MAVTSIFNRFRIFLIGNDYKLATSEESSIEVLTELSKNPNTILRKAVASNPNTPIEVLEKLSEEFPEIVKNNPIFDLLLLENPNSKFINLILARSFKTPRAKLVKIIDDCIDQNSTIYCDIIISAISNPQIDRETLNKFILRSQYYWINTYINLGISRNPNASPKILDMVLNKTFYSDSPKIYRQLAEHPNTSSYTLEQLATHGDCNIRSLVLKHPRSSNYTTAVVRLAEGKLKDIRFLEKLANSPSDSIRQLVAENDNITSEILEQLATDCDGFVRHKVANHPKASGKILDLVFESTNKFNWEYPSCIYETIAKHHNTLDSTLEKLAIYGDKKVRKKVLKHPKTSNYTISIIQFFQEKLYPETDLLNKLINIDRDEIRRLLAKHPDTSSEILIQLSQYKDKQTREKVGANSNTPLDILEKFANDKSDRIRSGVARNLSTPLEIINKLSRDPSKRVLIGIAQNPKTPEELLITLAKDTNNRVRCEVARNPNTPSNILEKLSEDKDDKVRKAVANNSHTPLNTLEKLSQDKIGFVRRAANKKYCHFI